LPVKTGQVHFGKSMLKVTPEPALLWTFILPPRVSTCVFTI